MACAPGVLTRRAQLSEECTDLAGSWALWRRDEVYFRAKLRGHREHKMAMSPLALGSVKGGERDADAGRGWTRLILFVLHAHALGMI